MNDTTLYRLTDILKTSLIKLEQKTVSKTEIQDYMEIVSNLMEYIEYDLLK